MIEVLTVYYTQRKPSAPPVTAGEDPHCPAEFPTADTPAQTETAPQHRNMADHSCKENMPGIRVSNLVILVKSLYQSHAEEFSRGGTEEKAQRSELN